MEFAGFDDSIPKRRISQLHESAKLYLLAPSSGSGTPEMVWLASHDLGQPSDHWPRTTTRQCVPCDRTQHAGPESCYRNWQARRRTDFKTDSARRSNPLRTAAIPAEVVMGRRGATGSIVVRDTVSNAWVTRTLTAASKARTLSDCQQGPYEAGRTPSRLMHGGPFAIAFRCPMTAFRSRQQIYWAIHEGAKGKHRTGRKPPRWATRSGRCARSWRGKRFVRIAPIAVCFRSIDGPPNHPTFYGKRRRFPHGARRSHRGQVR